MNTEKISKIGNEKRGEGEREDEKKEKKVKEGEMTYTWKTES